MEVGRARLVLDIRSGKMELEGSEEFVVGQFGRLAPLLAGAAAEGEAAAPGIDAGAAAGEAGRLSLAAVVSEPPAGQWDRGGASTRDTPGTIPPLPDSFDAWLERLPHGKSGAKDVERVIWAGYHIQLRSRDNAFTAPQVVRLLQQYGITVKYPSQAIHQNCRTGRVMRVARGHFRLTAEAIRKLLGRFAA